MSSNNVCIVAGVGPGLGVALCRRFAQAGMKVVMLARSAGKLSKYENDIREAGGVAHGIAADLSDFETVRDALRRAADAHGPASVLIFNAVAWVSRDPRTMTAEALIDDLKLCVASAQACVEGVYPAMKATGSGTILFTGGGVALYPQYGVDVPAAAAGKAALRSLALVLAERAKEDGIRVGTVTVAGGIGQNDAFAPDRVAEAFWNQHTAPIDAATETVYDGTEK